MKKLMRGALAGLSLVLAMTPVAQAAPVAVAATTMVPAPAWVPGSEWHYSDGYGLKVTGTSAQGTVFHRLDAPGQWFSRLGFIRKDGASATASRHAVYRTVPNEAGNVLSAAAPLTFQREYMSNGKLMVHASSWTIEGRETITVPAGTFDCFVIVWRTRSLRSDWTGFERWWYSPQTQHYVRMEYKYGAEPSASRVLMRYALGQAAPLAAPAAAPLTAPSLAPRVETAPLTEAGSQPQPQPEQAAKAAPVKQAEAPAKAKPVARETGKRGDWHAQFGSSPDAAAVRYSLRGLLAKHAKLRALPSGVSAHDLGEKGTFYRAWVGSYADSAGAMALCKSLKIGKSGCTVFKAPTILAKAGK
jgi:hypothetical protein